MWPCARRTWLAASVVSGVLLGACASEPQPREALQRRAVSAAQQRGASELGCPATTAEIVKGTTIQEPQGTGWYEQPHRAEYTVSVAGCGHQTTYFVACDDRERNACVAGPPPAHAALQQLVDKLRPGALELAEQQGAAELACPAAAAAVLRQETIQEPQGTGWYTPPHRAVYGIDVSGCGKRTRYLVTCDDEKKNRGGGSQCVAGVPPETPAASTRPQLADQLQPEAVKAAQQAGAAELACADTSADVVRKATLEEPQTTGWAELPHRAVYEMKVSGCDKRTTYVVACDDRKKTRCLAGKSGTPQ